MCILGKRTLLDSLSTFETQLNRALEQNALLENELDEKQQVRTISKEMIEMKDFIDSLRKLFNDCVMKREIYVKNSMYYIKQIREKRLN